MLDLSFWSGGAVVTKYKSRPHSTRHSLGTNLSAYQNYKSLGVTVAMERVLALQLIQLMSRQALLPSLKPEMVLINTSGKFF